MSSFMLEKSVCSFSMVVLSCLFVVSSGASADPVLDIVIAGQARQFGRDQLLRRPDAAEVAVSSDVAYGKPMNYRAVPLASLLVGLNPPPDSVIESVALDGFAAQLPLDLLTNSDPAKAVAWLAIEPADMPWPLLPGKPASAGPFYIVWTGATRVRSEQWPYQLARLASQPSPTARWPDSTSTRHCRQQIQAAPAWRCLLSNACLVMPSTAPGQAPSVPT